VSGLACLTKPPNLDREARPSCSLRRKLARGAGILLVLPGLGPAHSQDLWSLARQKASVHRFSTLFTAQDVRDSLATEQGLEEAVAWCMRYGITRVFVESFRDGYQVPQHLLLNARDYFRQRGFEVSGCVTPTHLGKASSGWRVVSCYTSQQTQERLQAIFEYTAGVFDQIMIDDFLFTDCTCEECDRARRSRTVTIGSRSFRVPGDSWSDYRLELMVQLSRHRILAPARRVNPRVRLILKYPQWYDRFHERGYDVIRQTSDFDLIWVGTETRDRDKRGAMPYEGYFLMRWLSGIGGRKTGGGWYDAIHTTEKTYLEQARGTVLAGARESMLFCYGGLHRDFGPADIEALHPHIPELIEVSGQVQARRVVGVAAYKPAGSPGGEEAYVFDYAGMLGLPLVPCHEFPEKARAAFFSLHALKDPHLVPRLNRLVRRGVPVLLTDGLAAKLGDTVNLRAPNVRILAVHGNPASLLETEQAVVDELRQWLLGPFAVQFSAPVEIALFLFDDGSWVIENFRDEPVTVWLNRQQVRVEARGWRYEWKS